MHEKKESLEEKQRQLKEFIKQREAVYEFKLANIGVIRSDYEQEKEF